MPAEDLHGRVCRQSYESTAHVYLRANPERLRGVGKQTRRDVASGSADCYAWACVPSRFVIVTGDDSRAEVLVGHEALHVPLGGSSRLCVHCHALLLRAQDDLAAISGRTEVLP